MENNFENFHLVAHSQGGITGRAMIQKYSNHGVLNFITFSTAHMGEFGIPYIKFPTFVNSLEIVSNLCFTKYMQRHNAVCNYWNDPFQHKKYLSNNLFLPILNNETYNPNSFLEKKNFLKISNAHFFGSPDDKVIVPWISSHFGFYKISNGTKENKQLVKIKNQFLYKNDTFGLRTLDEQNRLFLHTEYGFSHFKYLNSKKFFVKKVIPLLT